MLQQSLLAGASTTTLAAPAGLLLGAFPSAHAGAGSWVSADRDRAYDLDLVQRPRPSWGDLIGNAMTVWKVVGAAACTITTFRVPQSGLGLGDEQFSLLRCSNEKDSQPSGNLTDIRGRPPEATPDRH